MVEIWKDILDYEGYYQVSNTGKVRSIDRIDSRGWKRKGTEKKLTPTKFGGYQVTLNKNGKSKSVSLKTLMKAFEGVELNG